MEDGVIISTSTNNNDIDSTRWADMNFNELLEQKNILFNRYDFLVRVGAAEAAKKLLEGINSVDSFIAQKSLK